MAELFLDREDICRGEKKCPEAYSQRGGGGRSNKPATGRRAVACYGNRYTSEQADNKNTDANCTPVAKYNTHVVIHCKPVWSFY